MVRELEKVFSPFQVSFFLYKPRLLIKVRMKVLGSSSKTFHGVFNLTL